MKTIICSHGFGVKADSRGMFTEIANKFPGYTFKMFDYNEILSNGDVVVADIDTQAQKLQSVIDEAEGEIVMLCHSQGCIIAGLVDVTKVSEAILLAPPVLMSMQRVVEKLQNRPGSEINLDGVSKLRRTDGTTTHVPREYIQSLQNRDPIALYETLSQKIPVIIVRAAKDHVLGDTDLSQVSNAQKIDIDSDHDFTGSARAELTTILRKIL